MNEVYKKACTEVLEALKYIPLDEYHKIPYKTIAFMEENKDKDYNYKYDVKSPKMSKQANIIIIRLYLDYIANEKEKKIINEILELNSKKKIKTKTNEITIISKKNQNRKYDEYSEIHDFPIKIENTNWLKKLINKIKLIFIKRKS